MNKKGSMGGIGRETFFDKIVKLILFVIVIYLILKYLKIALYILFFLIVAYIIWFYLYMILGKGEKRYSKRYKSRKNRFNKNKYRKNLRYSRAEARADFG